MPQVDLHGLLAPPPPPAPAPRRPSVLALLVITQLAAVIGVMALAVLAHVGGVPFSQVSRDPATALGGAFVTGYLSYLGACLWCAAAAVALFSALLARRADLPGRWPAFLLATGLLSALLLIDDLFMVHDGLIPYALGGNDVERTILAVYLAVGVAWLVRFRALIAQTGWPLLLISGACFAAMVAVDTGIAHVDESRRHLLEDGPKFVGIANWAMWVIGTCLAHLSTRPASAAKRLAPIAQTGLPLEARPARIALLLGAAAALVTVLGLVGQWLRFSRGVEHSYGFKFQFAPDEEGNFATWFSSTLLLLAALSFFRVARRTAALAMPCTRHWRLLVGLLVFLSIDEASQLHEMTIAPLRQALGVNGVFHFTWVIPGAATALLVLLTSVGFLRRLPPATRRGLILATAVYLAGALGVEMAGGLYASRWGTDTFRYVQIASLEEGMEMAGAILLGYAAAAHHRLLPASPAHTDHGGVVSLSKQIS